MTVIFIFFIIIYLFWWLFSISFESGISGYKVPVEYLSPAQAAQRIQDEIDENRYCLQWHDIINNVVYNDINNNFVYNDNNNVVYNDNNNISINNDTNTNIINYNLNYNL